MPDDSQPFMDSPPAQGNPNGRPPRNYSAEIYRHSTFSRPNSRRLSEAVVPAESFTKYIQYDEVVFDMLSIPVTKIPDGVCLYSTSW